MTHLLALLPSTSATVTIDGWPLAAIGAAMCLSVLANIYLIIHVRRVERRMAQLDGQVTALRDVLGIKKAQEAAPTEEATNGDAP